MATGASDVSTKPYRPPNGTSGDTFRARMCDLCTKDVNNDCPIYLNALIHEVDEPEYPREWVQDAKGDPYGATARCTAFTLDPETADA